MPDVTELPAVFSPEFMVNPYGTIAALRRDDPVHRLDDLRLWFVTRHADVKRLLAEEVDVTPDTRAWEFYKPPPDGTNRRWIADRGLLALDAKEHARVRRLVTAAFTPRAVARMELQIADVVSAFAAPLHGRTGLVELMEEFISPIPNTVISRITGIPAIESDEAKFRELAHSVMDALLPFSSQEVLDRAEVALEQLKQWVRVMAEERRREPRADLISDLVLAHDAGGDMTNDEIVALVASLISVGSETTKLGGMVAIATLLQEPEIFRRLKDDRSLVPAAVLEILRHGLAGPSAMTRYAARDFELHGKQIKKGQMLMLSLGGANRDPDVFNDPDRFDLSRDHTDVLSFGRGAHYCLGAHLAKSELKAILNAVLDFLPIGATLRPDLIEMQPFGIIERPVTVPVDFGV